jgi:hypothetical protein
MKKTFTAKIIKNIYFGNKRVLNKGLVRTPQTVCPRRESGCSDEPKSHYSRSG